MSEQKQNLQAKGSRLKSQSNLEKRLKELDARLKVALAKRELRKSVYQRYYQNLAHLFLGEDEDEKLLH